MFVSRKDSGSEMITVSELKGNNLNNFCLLFTLHFTITLERVIN